MRTRQYSAGEPVIPTPHDVALAAASSRVLAQHLPSASGDVQLRLVEDGQETEARDRPRRGPYAVPPAPHRDGAGARRHCPAAPHRTHHPTGR